jgi:short-subunit dehydrogenase
MVARHHGGVVFLSSGSAMHGTPLSASYAASKAYDLILAESLWYEWRPLGVDVLGFIAGSTRTPGWEGNHPKPSRIVPIMDAEPAVAQALRALGHKPTVSSGKFNHLGYVIMNLMPRSWAVRLLASQMKTMFGGNTY